MGGDLLCPASETMQKVASVLRRGPTGSHLILTHLAAWPCFLSTKVRVHEPEAQPPNIHLGPLYCFHF